MRTDRPSLERFLRDEPGRDTLRSLFMEDVMSRYLNPLMVAIVGLIVLGLGFAYAGGRLEFGTFLFLGCVTVALGVVVLVFLGRMLNPEESLEQTLYKDEHPTERR